MADLEYLYQLPPEYGKGPAVSYKFDEVDCLLCGRKGIHRRGLHAHKNSLDCKAVVASKLAEAEGYIERGDVLGVANKPWAAPFLKKFKTGKPSYVRQNGQLQDRIWVASWWYTAFRQVDTLPNKIELLEKLHQLWAEGDEDGLEAHLGGIELARGG